MEKCGRRLSEEAFLFIDPPYYKMGSSLYTIFYRPCDHAELAKQIIGSRFQWIVTYDDVPQVRELYRGLRQYLFDMTYSLHEKRVGTELLVASKGLRLPEELRGRRRVPPHRVT
jgi:DNA adenine methylase